MAATLWHGYFGIENLALNDQQKQALITELRSLGPQSDPQPARLNHWRTRLDDEAAIFEALFDEDHLTIQAFKNRLGIIFGIDPGLISHTVNNQSFAGGTTPVVTFIYQAINRLRMALFGGVGADWNESGDECRGYLHLYAAQWDEQP